MQQPESSLLVGACGDRCEIGGVHTYMRASMHENVQTSRQTDRQADRQTDR